MKKKKTKRVEKEFTDDEIESYVQAFRVAKQEEPYRDPNEEKFPRDEEDLRHYIFTLEKEYAKQPTEQLREARYQKFRSMGRVLEQSTTKKGLTS